MASTDGALPDGVLLQRVQLEDGTAEYEVRVSGCDRVYIVSGEAKPVVTVDRGWFTSDIYINGELAKAATCAPTFRWRRVLRTARSKAGCCPSCGSEWGQPSPTLMALAALAMAMVAVAVTERQRGFNLLVWKS